MDIFALCERIQRNELMALTPRQKAAVLKLLKVTVDAEIARGEAAAKERAARRLLRVAASTMKPTRYRVHTQRENDGDLCSPILYVACPPDESGGWVRWRDVCHVWGEPPADAAVDPSNGSAGTPTTRESKSSSSPIQTAKEQA